MSWLLLPLAAAPHRWEILTHFRHSFIIMCISADYARHFSAFTSFILIAHSDCAIPLRPCACPLAYATDARYGTSSFASVKHLRAGLGVTRTGRNRRPDQQRVTFGLIDPNSRFFSPACAAGWPGSPASVLATPASRPAAAPVVPPLRAGAVCA